jgi:hypothetical protein
LQTSRTWSSRSHLVCSHGHTDASRGSGAIPRGYALSRQGLPRRDHKFGYRQLWRARVAECQSICTDTWGNKWTNHQTGNDAEQQYRNDAELQYRNVVIKAFAERALLFEWLNTRYTTVLAELAPGQTRENGRQ